MNRNKLVELVAQQIEDYQKILVAYSGGVDSSVLLHLLLEVRQQLRPDLAVRAIYIHHGLSQNADNWAEHCRKQCVDWQISFQAIPVQIDGLRGNIELQAREARYAVFRQQLQQGEALVTAHHLDDQCETFWLAVKRGSGPAGLSAMGGRTLFASSELIRPLLNISRLEIEEYAQQLALSWVQDESNQSDEFDRNFLRLDVLPRVLQRWPQFTAMTARSAQLCAEQESLLDELLAESLRLAIDSEGRIDIDYLALQSEVKRYAMLRRWLAQHHVAMPSREQLYILWQEVALARQDAEPQLQLGNKQIRRFKQQLYLLPMMQELSEVVIHWDMQSSQLLPDGLGTLAIDAEGTQVRKPTHDEKVTIRFSAQGKFRIVGRQGSRSIKKLWQELTIPTWQRQRIPMIYYNEQLIAAVGVFVTLEGAAEKEGSSLGLVINH